MMDLIRKASGMANFLFQYRDDKLSAKELQKVLKPQFSPIGSNRRTSQEIVMTKLLDFVNCVEGGILISWKLFKVNLNCCG